MTLNAGPLARPPLCRPPVQAVGVLTVRWSRAFAVPMLKGADTLFALSARAAQRSLDPRERLPRTSVKDVAQPRLTPVAIVLLTVVRVVKVRSTLRLRRAVPGRDGACALRRSELNELVQLSTVQPDPTAVWAVIDFNALPVRHEQGCLGASGALHSLRLHVSRGASYLVQYEPSQWRRHQPATTLTEPPRKSRRPVGLSQTDAV